MTALVSNNLHPRIGQPPIGPGAKAKVIAVTGGAGFIGSHLCEYLLKRGAYVVCLDNFHTGSRANLAKLMESERFVLTPHDVTERLPGHLPAFDEIYNLACPASPVHYQSDRIRTARVCAEGAFNVLERAARDGARVLQASTSEIYGDPDVHPQPEGYFGNVNTVGPRSCYDEGKRFAETLFTDYGAQSGITIRIARIFNTYGPNMQPDDGRVVSNFIIQALRGEDITIYGNGNQTRSFCYVDDLVEGLARLMAHDGEDGPFNLGNPLEITVGDLARIIIDLTGSRSRIAFRPLPQDDPRRRKPDIGKATSHLRWTPAVSLQDGLQRSIAYFSGHSLLSGMAAELYA